MFKQIRNRTEWSDKSVSQKGFTLIELLVVIAILGILAVVGVLSFGGLTAGAHTATAKTELTEVQTAADTSPCAEPDQRRSACGVAAGTGRRRPMAS